MTPPVQRGVCPTTVMSEASCVHTTPTALDSNVTTEEQQAGQDGKIVETVCQRKEGPCRWMSSHTESERLGN